MRTEVLQKIAELDKTDINEFGKKLSELFESEGITLHGKNELSRREKEIIKLVDEGFSNQKIADFIHISRRTVEVHRANIIKKLGLKSHRSQLLDYVKANGVG